MGLVFAVVVYWTPSVMISEGVYPLYFYLILLLVYAVHQVRHSSLSDAAIRARDVSDLYYVRFSCPDGNGNLAAVVLCYEQ